MVLALIPQCEKVELFIFFTKQQFLIELALKRY